MGNPIGLQVVERQGAGVPVLNGSDVTNTGAVVQGKLGPVNQVIPISSLSNFETIFGGPETSQQAYYEIKGLFQNAAPYDVNVYCLRVADSNGTASSHQLGTSPDTTTFERGYLGDISPGSAGDDCKIELVAQSNGDFTLNIYLVDENGADVLVESHTDLNDDNIDGEINSRSKYIVVTTSGTGALSALSKTALAGGVDPTYPSEPSTDQLGNYDNYNIQLLFAPDYNTQAAAQNLENYAAAQGDVLAIAAAPMSETPDNVGSNYSTNLQKSKSYLAAYYNWMEVDDGFGDTLYTPAMGHVIGAYYVRKLEANGGYAFVAPAGLNVSLRGVRSQNRELSSSTIESLVHDDGLNVVQFYKGYGFVVRTSRTMSTLSKHYSIHIRRSMNFLISTFRSQMGTFEQRPNNADTRRQLEDTLTNFLVEQYEAGMFETIGGFDSNVQVVCDTTNNDLQVRQNRQLVADVAMNFAEVAETVYINLRQVTGQIVSNEG